MDQIPGLGSDQNALPSDLQTIVDDLNHSDRAAQAILHGLSDEQANWQPRETAWSIAQCVDHLARTNALYAAALHAATNDARSACKLRQAPIRPGWLSRYFIGTLEPPPKSKLRAPKKAIPVSHASGADVLRSFHSSQEQIRAVIREGAALNLNQIRFRNPFVGFLRFTVGAGLLIIAAHDRRHLWQAAQVRNSPGFPSS